MMDGAGVIVWAALGEYYGRTRFATLRGYITFAYAWALVASPVYAGWIYDQFGSYNRAIVPGAHLRDDCRGVFPVHQAATGIDYRRCPRSMRLSLAADPLCYNGAAGQLVRTKQLERDNATILEQYIAQHPGSAERYREAVGIFPGGVTPR